MEKLITNNSDTINASIQKVKEELGDVRTIGSKEVGETPEEKAAREAELEEKAYEQARLTIIRTFKTQLLQIKDELNKGKSFDDILNEISEKKSNMSRSTRDFCMNFKKEAILGYLNDLHKAKKKVK